MTNVTIGCIGQGFIGKHMADDFEERGYRVVRFGLEEQFKENNKKIAACDVVFIAVPTPTTPDGFDASIVRSVLGLVGPRKIAVIKSTVLPGTTKELARLYPDLHIVHAPEFLREKSAAIDARQPTRTIIGIPEATSAYQEVATQLLAILPKAPYELVCSSDEAELIKYGGNCFLALKVVYMNLLANVAENRGASYATIAKAIAADDRIGESHMKVIDGSDTATSYKGRGAGGHCFPKDLAALREFYVREFKDDNRGIEFLLAVENLNRSLLENSGKDTELMRAIYGTR